MANFRRKKASARGYMARKAFRQGFYDNRTGSGWRTEYNLMTGKDQLTYERGFMFATACPDITSIKDGRRVDQYAVDQFRNALGRKDIL